MKYVKPEVVVLAKATAAIQGQKGGIALDNVDPSRPSTAAAYEADE